MYVCGPSVVSAKHKLRQLSEHPGFERAGSLTPGTVCTGVNLKYRVCLQVETPLEKVLGGVLSGELGWSLRI